MIIITGEGNGLRNAYYHAGVRQYAARGPTQLHRALPPPGSSSILSSSTREARAVRDPDRPDPVQAVLAILILLDLLVLLLKF
jgi:hypothetical protein